MEEDQVEEVASSKLGKGMHTHHTAVPDWPAIILASSCTHHVDSYKKKICAVDRSRGGKGGHSSEQSCCEIIHTFQ